MLTVVLIAALIAYFARPGFWRCGPKCGLECCDNLRDLRCEALLCREHCNYSTMCGAACLSEEEEESEEEWSEWL